MKEIKWLAMHPDAKIYPPFHKGDVGYDITTIESKTIWPFLPQKVRTGVAIEAPEGYYCTVETRSGHGIKNSLRCHRGIIDNGFRGEISVKIYNHGWKPYNLTKGEKLAQLVFHPISVSMLKQVQEMSGTTRGVSGFGSTGK
jgi:dUTP pyrophosphatase